MKDRVISDFDLSAEALEGVDIIAYNYTYEDYSGTAYVLGQRGGQLFEVHGSHCSCYGLEGQWSEEPVTREYLLSKLEENKTGHRYDYFHGCSNEVRQFLTLN